MDRKQSVVANVRYQSAAGRGAKTLKGLLRYVQYREDRDGHIPQRRGLERWTDKGLGNNFQTIAARCEELKSAHVQAFTWVFNPNPDLVGLLPEDRREVFVRELTESTLDTFFEARGLETPEYAYAIHRRTTTDETMPGRDNPHAHVILPGTYDSWADGDRLPLYMNRNKRENHIELLHEVAQQQLDRLLQREVGLDWEQRYDRLTTEREQLAEILSSEESPEPDTAVEAATPHGLLHDEAGATWKAWIATQVVSPTISQVGLMLASADLTEEDDPTFVPLVRELTPAQADQVAQHLLRFTQADPERGWNSAFQWAEQVQAMNNAQRAYLLDMRPSTSASPDPMLDAPNQTWSGPSFDL